MIAYPSFITYMLVTATLIVVSVTGAYLLFALIPLAAAALARALAPVRAARTPPPLAQVSLTSHHVLISAGSMIREEEAAWRERYEVPLLPQGGWVSGACRNDEGDGWWTFGRPPYDPLEKLERLASTADLAAPR